MVVLIGERWALEVLPELMLGPKRFSDIRADLPGISANILTLRLDGLGQAGIVARPRLDPPASGRVYALTEWGELARPIIGAMGRPFARPRFFEGAPAAVAEAVYGGVPPAALERQRALVIKGDRALAEQFVTLFPLPPKASRP